MFVDELSTRESLVRMVRRLTANLALREDLLQEALIHLWLTETRRPGQTKSWYLQSCKYHLLHYLASGRSVDSGKRRAGQWVGSQLGDEWDAVPEESDSGNSVLTLVSARDIISLLSPQLLPHEKAVLYCFADGLGPREIGRKLNMSHTMVIKHRRKIAWLFHRLDVPKPYASSVRFGPSPLTNGIPANKQTNGGNGSKSRHVANGNGLGITASHSNIRPLSKQLASLSRQPGQLSLTAKPRNRSVRNGFLSFTSR